MGTADREVMSIVSPWRHVHKPAGRAVVNQDLIVNPLGQERREAIAHAEGRSAAETLTA
jgi:hypothetical protein